MTSEQFMDKITTQFYWTNQLLERIAKSLEGWKSIAKEDVPDSTRSRVDALARETLAEMSGLPVDAPTDQHHAKIIFGDVPHPISVPSPVNSDDIGQDGEEMS